MRVTAIREGGEDEHCFSMLHDAFHELRMLEWLVSAQSQARHGAQVEFRNNLERTLFTCANNDGFDASKLHKRGWVVPQRAYFSAEECERFIEVSKTILPSKPQPPPGNPDSCQNETFMWYNKNKHIKKLMEQTLLQPQLLLLLRSLLGNKMRMPFARRGRKQEGKLQMAHRPSGWQNYTATKGFEGHFDSTGGKFSLLVGICLKAP